MRGRVRVKRRYFEIEIRRHQHAPKTVLTCLGCSAERTPTHNSGKCRNVGNCEPDLLLSAPFPSHAEWRPPRAITRLQKAAWADRRRGARHTVWRLSPRLALPNPPPPRSQAPLRAPLAELSRDANVSARPREFRWPHQEKFACPLPGLELGDAWSARGGIPNQASHRAEAHGTKRETGILNRDSNVRLIDDAEFGAFALWLRQRRSRRRIPNRHRAVQQFRRSPAARRRRTCRPRRDHRRSPRGFVHQRQVRRDPRPYFITDVGGVGFANPSHPIPVS